MEELFINAGAEFLTSYSDIAEKHKNIRAYIFDWDGVFNDGIKGEGISSPFYEADSMGINMLRFAYWLTYNKLPLTAIISGENNSSAFNFARREHIDTVYYSVKNKHEALEHLKLSYDINYQHFAYIFDDILDLPVARECGLRFLVRSKGSPAFTEYVKSQKLSDYISANSGSEHAVREISELLLKVSGNFENVIEKRITPDISYIKYLAQRNTLATSFFTIEKEIFIKKNPV